MSLSEQSSIDELEIGKFNDKGWHGLVFSKHLSFVRLNIFGYHCLLRNFVAVFRSSGGVSIQKQNNTLELKLQQTLQNRITFFLLRDFVHKNFEFFQGVGENLTPYNWA